MTMIIWRNVFGPLACIALLGVSACSTNRADISQEPRSSPGARYPSSARGGVGVSSADASDVGGDASTTRADAGLGMGGSSGTGTYVVKPGDTLNRIGREVGYPWKDLARWNNLEDPHRLEVGQVLQVAPPADDVQQPAPVRTPRVDSRPVPTEDEVDLGSGGLDGSALRWSWPASGSVLSNFGEKSSKGMAFAGRAGDPVLAAADGRVVYSGGGLRGYGNLVIVKHANNYLTAYAHNQALLVKEDQTVRRGQKIAEMGSTDAERVKLHFEVRRDGKPIDPLKVLPAR